MKKTILILLVILLTACSQTPQPKPTVTSVGPIATTEATTVVAATSTLEVIAPSATLSPSNTPESTTSPSPTPFTNPVVVKRFPMNEGIDGIGFGSSILALPGGELWEATSSGGVRVYDSTDMTVLKSLDLQGQQYGLARLAGDEDFVWVMFYGASEVADLFRVSRTDHSFQKVQLPEECTYDACQWSIMMLDHDVLWVGGYDELWALNTSTLEEEAKFVFSEQAGTFNPADIVDLEVTEDGRLWALFSTDTSYIVVLDRQKVLDGVEQEPEMIQFMNNTVQFVRGIGDSVLAGESRSGNVVEQAAVLYRLDETGVERSPADGSELSDEQDFFLLAGMNITEDGRYIWLVDDGGRKLYWIDPVEGEVAGELQLYPGETPTEDDPNMVMAIGFDGEYLWASGSEIFRIALPWAE